MVQFLRRQYLKFRGQLLIPLLPEIRCHAQNARVLHRIHHRLDRNIAAQIPKFGVLMFLRREHMPEQTMHQHMHIRTVQYLWTLDISV